MASKNTLNVSNSFFGVSLGCTSTFLHHRGRYNHYNDFNCEVHVLWLGMQVQSCQSTWVQKYGSHIHHWYLPFTSKHHGENVKAHRLLETYENGNINNLCVNNTHWKLTHIQYNKSDMFQPISNLYQLSTSLSIIWNLKNCKESNIWIHDGFSYPIFSNMFAIGISQEHSHTCIIKFSLSIICGFKDTQNDTSHNDFINMQVMCIFLFWRKSAASMMPLVELCHHCNHFLFAAPLVIRPKSN